jgi:hypothetical protein
VGEGSEQAHGREWGLAFTQCRTVPCALLIGSFVSNTPTRCASQTRARTSELFWAHAVLLCLRSGLP